MADAEKPVGPSVGTPYLANVDQKPPESPTTARELDFDDEEEVSTASPKPKPVQGAESTARPDASATQAPQQPPRPVSPREQAESTLREAFPSIDATVVKAVLAASGGQVEPAFNALLGKPDPAPGWFSLTR